MAPRKTKYEGDALKRKVVAECVKVLAPNFANLAAAELELKREELRVHWRSPHHKLFGNAIALEAELVALMKRIRVEVPGLPSAEDCFIPYAYLAAMLATHDATLGDQLLDDYGMPRLNDPEKDPRSWLVWICDRECLYWPTRPSREKLIALSLFAKNEPASILEGVAYTVREVFAEEGKRIDAARERVSRALPVVKHAARIQRAALLRSAAATADGPDSLPTNPDGHER
jgi:hypothetical protein